MSDPADIPRDAYASTAGELRALARVLRAALGLIVAYWRREGLEDRHPYCQAAAMVDGYLRRRYNV